MYRAVAVQFVHADAGAPGPRRRFLLADPIGKPREEMQSCGGATHADLGEVPDISLDGGILVAALLEEQAPCKVSDT